MRHFCLLVVLAVLVISEPASVDCCRPLRSTETVGDATGEAVRGVKVVRVSVEDGMGRVLEEKQVATMAAAAGPSRKGSLDPTLPCFVSDTLMPVLRVPRHHRIHPYQSATLYQSCLWLTESRKMVLVVPSQFRVEASSYYCECFPSRQLMTAIPEFQWVSTSCFSI
ncbi:putative Receptor-like protein kinase [Hibiscus syriacus]|uniref:Receptor-like protein kinase n=1 Tax=Hibiscus syriacus TaxID=106335 RepID=A0A6A2ZXT6_HIBSY|nr:putative Receptor-like protein kinase [Hibiscus syriacus]